MNYNDMQSKVFMTVSRPDGYFGSTITVGLALDGCTLVEVSSCGCYRSPVLPTVADETEARWLIANRSDCKAFYTPVNP